jgi:hypothetical protein
MMGQRAFSSLCARGKRREQYVLADLSRKKVQSRTKQKRNDDVVISEGFLG